MHLINFLCLDPPAANSSPRVDRMHWSIPSCALPRLSLASLRLTRSRAMADLPTVRCASTMQIYASIFALYLLSLSAVYLSFRHAPRPTAHPTASIRRRPSPPGHVPLRARGRLLAAARFLCRERLQPSRTSLAHVHIPKSGGTAFAHALRSECVCPGRGSRPCAACPRVLADASLPAARIHRLPLAARGGVRVPRYARGCKRYAASARTLAITGLDRTSALYAQTRLTTGWPCGVHAGYSRTHACVSQRRLPGVRHVLIGLFREPVARYLSEFRQTTAGRVDIDTWDWCAKLMRPMSLDAYIRMPVDYPFQSRVVKMLAGDAGQTGAAGADWTRRGVRGRALKQALEVVRGEEFVFGIAERMGETMELFRFVFRRAFKEAPACHAHKNGTDGSCPAFEIGAHDGRGRRMVLTEGQRVAFLEKNREDVIVYEEAKRVFEVRMKVFRSLQQLGSDFSIDNKCRELLAN